MKLQKQNIFSINLLNSEIFIIIMSVIVDQKSNRMIDSFFGIITYEKNRIMKRGPQALIGLGLAIFFFCCLPTLVYPLYCLLPYQNIELFTALGLGVAVGLPDLILNLIINHIYIAKYPYFEQYRIMDKSWP